MDSALEDLWEVSRIGKVFALVSRPVSHVLPSPPMLTERGLLALPIATCRANRYLLSIERSRCIIIRYIIWLDPTPGVKESGGYSNIF